MDVLRELKPVLLIFPFDVMAHYVRCIELARHLQPYYTIKMLYSPRYHSFVANAGFSTFECATLNADKVQQNVRSFDFSWLNEKELYNIYQQQIQVIKGEHASAVLGDMSPTLKMAAEKSGVPYFSLMNAYMSRYYGYVRRMPRSYPLFRLFNLLPPDMIANFTFKGEQLFFRKMHKAFSNIRNREALLSRNSYLEELEGDINLVCDLPTLFPQHELPANYHFVPPLFYPLSDAGNHIASQLDPAKKVLFVSMGSTGSWRKMAFLNRSEYRRFNIVTVGDHDKVIHGDHVFSHAFVSSRKLFDKVDLVICHGGNGTTYQALSCGIPVLCKTSHLEQGYNVDGLERLQVGCSLDELKDEKDYLPVINKWIDKKNSPNFLLIKNQIAEANSNIGNVLREIFHSSLPEFLPQHSLSLH